MKADIIYRGKDISETFPKNNYQLYDLADKLRNELPFTVYLSEFFEYESIDYKLQIETWEDLERFNLLAEQMEYMDETGDAKMYALMKANPNADVSELLDMTYGLESITAYSCSNDDELAELAFDNDWLIVFEDCHYDIFEFLDKEKVADEVRSQHNGYIYGGYYVEPDEYIRPDINIELPQKVSGFFRLLLAADCDGRIDRNRAEWLTLPCSKEEINEIEQRQNSKASNMICLAAESSLPMISPNSITQGVIAELNELAEKLSELSKADFIKLKAVMEMGEVNEIEWTIDVVKHLDAFDFDPNPKDESVFGKIFLYNTLPQGFDTEVFSSADLSEFGESILSAKGGMITSYGAVTGQGNELYTPVYTEHEQTESEESEERTEMLFS